MQGIDLQLDEEWLEEWDSYKKDLLNSSVRLSDAPDELRWVFAQNGLYSPKMGYKWMMTQKGWENPVWWAKPLWKLKGLAKTRIFSCFNAFERPLYFCVVNHKADALYCQQK